MSNRQCAEPFFRVPTLLFIIIKFTKSSYDSFTTRSECVSKNVKKEEKWGKSIIIIFDERLRGVDVIREMSLSLRKKKKRKPLAMSGVNGDCIAFIAKRPSIMMMRGDSKFKWLGKYIL